MKSRFIFILYRLQHRTGDLFRMNISNESLVLLSDVKIEMKYDQKRKNGPEPRLLDNPLNKNIISKKFCVKIEQHV